MRHPEQADRWTWLILAAYTQLRLACGVVADRSTDSEVFETYIEQFLVPSLEPGRVVTMDNLNAHKGERVRKLIEEADCKLLYLPTYSPDLNPIEEAFAKVKAILRQAETRAREVLLEVLKMAMSAVTADDACGFF